MSPERWKKVEAIFTAALAFDSREREEFVSRACGGDEDLLNHVSAMLTTEEENSESFFEFGVAGLFGNQPADASVDNENINRRVGAYRLVKELGRGGMGAVYLAERADEEFRQQVAVKLIKRGMDTDLILERFRNERQILADLNHPNIARLLDGGTTPEGLPYFVMEYIDGQSIIDYCNDRRLSVKERLRLFLQVCSAVRHAHQKTIVHRDIKPTNTLVTTEGTAKLLDFGIAKILASEHSSGSLETTMPTLRLMTPEYASPEHAIGKPVTAASDVYSLGVLLFKLLTGHHPFRFQNCSPEEIVRLIGTEAPEKPSEIIFNTNSEGTGKDRDTAQLTPEIISSQRSTTVVQLQAKLKGDLDGIILKAMQKEPILRHQSVGQLTEEIEQHLAHQGSSSNSSQLAAFNAGSGTPAAILFNENDLAHNNEQNSTIKIDSARKRGIKQAALLMMVGTVGTPLVVFLSLQFKLRPTWMLIFALLTVLSGILRLCYALIFEESMGQNTLPKVNRNSVPTTEYENPVFSNEYHANPGNWLDDTANSVQNKDLSRKTDNHNKH